MNSEFPEQGPRLSHVVIDVGDHPEERGDLIGLVLVHIEVFLRAMKRAVRSVGRHISKERLSLLHASTDEFVPLSKNTSVQKPLALTILSL